MKKFLFTLCFLFGFIGISEAQRAIDLSIYYDSLRVRPSDTVLVMYRGNGSTFDSTVVGRIGVGASGAFIGVTVADLRAYTNSIAITPTDSTFTNLGLTVLSGNVTITDTVNIVGSPLIISNDYIDLDDGSQNVIVGSDMGASLPTGTSNTYIGNSAGEKTAGQNVNRNTAVGNSAGGSSTFTATGDDNTSIGNNAGIGLTSGNNNTFLGSGAGANTSTGAGNVYLGYQAGIANTTQDNQLYIENSSSATPLIYGDFSKDSITFNAGEIRAIGNVTGGAVFWLTNNGGTGGSEFRMSDVSSGADWKFKATASGQFKIRDQKNAFDVIVIDDETTGSVTEIRDRLEVDSVTLHNGALIVKGKQDPTPVGSTLYKNFIKNSGGLGFYTEYDTIYTGLWWWEEDTALNQYPSVAMTVHGSTFGNLNSNDHNHLSIYTTDASDTTRTNRWSMQFGVDYADLDIRSLRYHLQDSSWLFADGVGGVAIDNTAKFSIGTTTPTDVIFDFYGTTRANHTQRMRTEDNGYSTLGAIEGGLELMMDDGNTTNKYTPAIFFGSDDANFTTSPYKRLAGITGYATEGYFADTDGGMGVEIFGSIEDVGTAESYTSIMKFETDSVFTPSKFVVHDNNIDLTQSGTGSNPRIRLFSDDGLGTSFFDVIDQTLGQATLRKVSATGESVFQLDARPDDGTGYAEYRFFRGTNTTGKKYVTFYDGNATSGTSNMIGVDTTTYFGLNGENFGIGTSSPNYTLEVAGTVMIDDILKINPQSAVSASGITAEDGMIIYVNTTDATFTSVGIWARENGAWVKL